MLGVGCSQHDTEYLEGEARVEKVAAVKPSEVRHRCERLDHVRLPFGSAPVLQIVGAECSCVGHDVHTLTCITALAGLHECAVGIEATWASFLGLQ